MPTQIMEVQRLKMGGARRKQTQNKNKEHKGCRLKKKIVVQNI